MAKKTDKTAETDGTVSEFETLLVDSGMTPDDFISVRECPDCFVAVTRDGQKNKWMR